MANPPDFTPTGTVLYLRIDCEHCGRWECLPCYAEDAPRRSFMRVFWRCRSCGRIVCELCAPGQAGEKPVTFCPFCGHKRWRRMEPRHIVEETKPLREGRDPLVLVVPVRGLKKR